MRIGGPMHDKYKKQPGVYIFTNLKNGKVYIGESINIKDRFRRYGKPSKLRPFESALNKYGLDGFKIEIEYLPDFKKDDLLDLEEALIKRFDCLCPKGYNICPRGTNRVGAKHSIETKKKISRAQTGRKASDETRKKMRTSGKGSMKGRKMSDIFKEKQRINNTGRKHSEESRIKISLSKTGAKHSEETRKKMSLTRIDKKYPRIVLCEDKEDITFDTTT